MTTKWKRTVITTAAMLVGLIGSGMAFVTYFMHAVYEEEEEFIDRDQVPGVVLRHFAKLYPDVVEPEWEFEEGTYEAEFLGADDKEIEIVFQPNGDLDRIVTEIELEHLPDQALDYLRAQDGYDIIEPERIVRGETVQYEAKLFSRLLEWNCLFDRDGQLIRKTRDGPILE